MLYEEAAAAGFVALLPLGLGLGASFFTLWLSLIALARAMAVLWRSVR
jgi:hypothetical protein